MGFHVNLDQLIDDQNQERKYDGVAKFHNLVFANIRAVNEAAINYSLR